MYQFLSPQFTTRSINSLTSACFGALAWTGRTYYGFNASNHHHFYFEDRHELVDIPSAELSVKNLPPVPEGYEIERMDVVIRLRRKRSQTMVGTSKDDAGPVPFSINCGDPNYQSDVPFWPAMYGTYLVVTMSMRASSYDRSRIEEEVGPLLVKASSDIRRILDGCKMGGQDV